MSEIPAGLAFHKTANPIISLLNFSPGLHRAGFIKRIYHLWTSVSNCPFLFKREKVLLCLSIIKSMIRKKYLF